MRAWLAGAFWLALSLPVSAAAPQRWTYWIQPCTPEIAQASGCHAGDTELGVWALEAWQKSAAGALQIAPAKSENDARLRLYWANARGQLYGEARPVLVHGERGAEVFVLPSIAGVEGDPLMRDAIVYLTCLHETGHALGLAHTRAFADIMYSFQYGGDVPAYFGRYRQTIAKRSDIRGSAGLSDADRAALADALRAR